MLEQGGGADGHTASYAKRALRFQEKVGSVKASLLPRTELSASEGQDGEKGHLESCRDLCWDQEVALCLERLLVTKVLQVLSAAASQH